MEVIEVDSPPPALCEENLQELFSVDWRSASDMFWQLENRKSSLLEYLSEYGPRDFPNYKKILKKLKRTLTKLESGEPSHHDHPNGSEKAELGKFRALLDDVARHVTVATVRLNQPGLRKFFVEGIGKDVLSSLERRHSCSIEPVCESPSPVALTEGLESRFSSDLVGESLFAPSEDKEDTPWNGLSSLGDIEEVSKQGESYEVESYEVEMEKRIPSPVATSLEECICIKNTHIRITVGDLIQEITDAVLILNNERLCLEKRGVLNAQIARFAGAGLKEECKRIVERSGPRLPGEALITGSGNLPFKHLVHVINYPGSPQILDLQLSVKRGLQLADAHGLSSIALPAIGAGSIGLSLQDSARIVSGGILSFLDGPPLFLREIKVVLYLESTLWTYYTEIETQFVPLINLEEYSPLSSLVQGKEPIPTVLQYLNPPPSRENSLGNRNPKPPVSTTEFRIYGKEKKNIMATIDSLRTVYAKHRAVQRIGHKLVPQVTRYCWPLLSTVASQYDVDLITEDSNSSAFTVCGNSEDVSFVAGRIWEEITRFAEQQNDIERRKLLAHYVRWHYIILDKEIGFNDELSAIIEDARNRKCEGVNLLVNDCEYRVDFNSMTVLYNRSNYPPLPLCRRKSAEAADFVPHFWAPQPCLTDGAPAPIAMVNILPGNPEYQHVASLFYSTGGNGSIVTIERVQNLPLYKQYTMHRQEVKNKNFYHNERQLFHGTKGCNVRAINSQGFNRSFCGRNGAAYGNGVYFAANASYSMDFTAPDSNKLRHMYLARVVVGFYVKGRKGLLVPPPLSPEVPEVLFDSVVDRESNPRTFVVFKDSQCYPEYLITFS